MLASIGLIAIMLLPSIVKADFYSKSAKAKWLGIIVEPHATAYIVIDTSGDTLVLSWDSEGYIYFPYVGAFFMGSWHVWDDKGFNKKSPSPVGGEGSKTFFYPHTYTWVHAEVKWDWILASPVPTFLTSTARIDLYIEGGDSGGGGPPKRSTGQV